MDTSTTLVYDGSFNGFLSCIYISFKRKGELTAIKKTETGEQELFANEHYVPTDVALAKLVWNGISQKRHAAIRTIYFAFLSEAENIEDMLRTYIQYLMGVLKVTDMVDIHSVSVTLHHLAEKVAVEKRRVESFVQFQATEEGYLAYIKPKYNVLPLLSKHLKEKYRDVTWQVFDHKRHYGLLYNRGMLQFTPMHAKLGHAV